MSDNQTAPEDGSAHAGCGPVADAAPGTSHRKSSRSTGHSAAVGVGFPPNPEKDATK